MHLHHLARKDYRTPSATAPLFLSLSFPLSKAFSSLLDSLTRAIAATYSRSSCYRTYSFRLAADYSLEIARVDQVAALLDKAVAG